MSAEPLVVTTPTKLRSSSFMQIDTVRDVQTRRLTSARALSPVFTISPLPRAESRKAEARLPIIKTLNTFQAPLTRTYYGPHRSKPGLETAAVLSDGSTSTTHLSVHALSQRLDKTEVGLFAASA